MFGGSASVVEPGNTLFDDSMPAGFTHFIEWQTTAPVHLTAFNLFAGGDGPQYNNEREFASFVLKAKLKASDSFVTIYTYTPTHPFTFIDPNTAAVISTSVAPVDAQYFRAEFVQYTAGRGFDGPRIIELDGYGPDVPVSFPDVRDDLFDIHEGAQVLSSSPIRGGFLADAMFGNDSPSQETGTTIFADGQPPGFTHYIEWKTAIPVELDGIALFAGGDDAIYNHEREFQEFTLKAKLREKDDYITLGSFTPNHPYEMLDPDSLLMLLGILDPPIDAQYFRAEFVQWNAGRGYDGPRVVELDGYGGPALMSLDDGILDSWRLQYFSSITDPNAAATADPDNDGANNFQEFLDGTNPLQPDPPRTPLLSISPAGGSYTAPVQVQITGRGPTVIRYTTDGSDPTPNSPLYAGPISVSTSSTVRARLYYDTNPVSAVSSASYTITAAHPLTITTPLTNQTVTAGSNVSLKVVAEGPGPLTYSWTFNGTPIPQATGDSLLLNNVQPSQAGDYKVTVTSGTDSVSSTAHLTVALPPAHLAITTPLADQTIVVGATLTLKVIAQGPTTLTYVWKFNGSPIIEATGDTLVIPNIQPAQAGDYSVTVFSGSDFLTSTAHVTVQSGQTPPPLRIVTPLTDQTVIAGVSVTFKVVAEGPAPLTYSWRYNGNSIVGANTDTLLIPNAQPAQSGDYTVTVFSGADVLSSTAHLTVNLPPPPPEQLTITTPLTNQSVLIGSDVTLKIVAQGTFYAYGWTFNGNLINGQNTDTLLLTNIQPSQAGAYVVTVYAKTNSLSSTGLVTVVDGRPAITSQPQSQSVPLGHSINFSVTASSSEPITYQWSHDGTPIDGATAATLVIADVEPATLGTYRVAVSNKYGVTVSDPATLSLVAADTEAPVVTITSPAPGSTSDTQITLAGTATDNLSVTSLQLERDGTLVGPIGLGADGHFSVANLLLHNGTNVFRVIASDGIGNKSSASVAVLLQASRVIFIPDLAPVQEGGVVTVPLLLQSRGEVGAATVSLTYDPESLADPQIDWPALLTGWTQVNNNHPGELRLSFALPGIAIPAGTEQLATITFRARSVPHALDVPLTLQLLGAYSSAGDPFSAGTDVNSGKIHLTARKIIGDNNANDRLDVGDASVIMRLVAGLDPTRSWDIPANDLNGNSSVDAGDAIRVLRVAVNLDPQPVVPAVSAQSFDDSGAQLQLLSDQTRLTPGGKVLVTLRLNSSKPVAGAAFKVQYPVDALTLDSAVSHRVGALVPSSALAFWNVSPAQTDYAKQDGTLYGAFSSPTVWPSGNGELAALTFTVKTGATTRLQWPIQVRQIEISDGIGVHAVSPADLSLTGRDPAPPSVAAISFTSADGTFSFNIAGDPGAKVHIQVSEDLSTWNEVGTFTIDTDQLTVTDRNSRDYVHRYYRTIPITPAPPSTQ